MNCVSNVTLTFAVAGGKEVKGNSQNFKAKRKINVRMESGRAGESLNQRFTCCMTDELKEREREREREASESVVTSVTCKRDQEEK